MRAEAIDYRSAEREERNAEIREYRQNLITPARRAGLEALQREFDAFLKARQR